jgi:hypothetical protein
VTQTHLEQLAELKFTVREKQGALPWCVVENEPDGQGGLLETVVVRTGGEVLARLPTVPARWFRAERRRAQPARGPVWLVVAATASPSTAVAAGGRYNAACGTCGPAT